MSNLWTDENVRGTLRAAILPLSDQKGRRWDNASHVRQAIFNGGKR